MKTFDSGYALIIGIANYAHLPRLPSTILKDATDLGTLLTDRDYCGYKPAQVRHLLDEQATAANIRSGLTWLAQQTGPEDTVLIYFSGHAGRFAANPLTETYLLPWETNPKDQPKTAIAGPDLARLLQSIQAEQLVLLFDCCHGGQTGTDKATLEQTIPGLQSGLAQQDYEGLGSSGRAAKRAIISSARLGEPSWQVTGLRNSLFMYFWLEALRGEARTYGDGLLRVLDLFNFVAEEVPKCRPQQPTLTAGLLTNFPLALYRGDKWSGLPPGERPRIEHASALSVPAEAKVVLKNMFADYERVVVKKKVGRDSPDQHSFLTQSFKRNNGPDAAAVVKIGSVDPIEQEWWAYHHCIRHRLPANLGIQNQPILPAGYQGGLRYSLADQDSLAVQNLQDYCRHASPEDIRVVWEERLLRMCEQLLRFHGPYPDFPLGASYDSRLPPNLIIEPVPLPPDQPARLIRPDRLPQALLEPGDYVRLEGFLVTELDLLAETITLNLPASPRGVPAAYRLKLKSVGASFANGIGETIRPIAGQVVETRQGQLAAAVERLLGFRVRPEDKILATPDGTTLPNPLRALKTILSQRPQVKVGCIHGSLHLEDILVDPATRQISLINFDTARPDHLLHDFLQLETEVATRLLPDVLAEAGLGAEAVISFYRRLHRATLGADQSRAEPLPTARLEQPFSMLVALREVAGHYLARPDDWREYYGGLVIYLLGRIATLSPGPEDPAPLPRQVALWGAATTVALLNTLPKPKFSNGAGKNGHSRNGATNGRTGMD